MIILQKYDHQTAIILGNFNAVCDPQIDGKWATGQTSLLGNKLPKSFYYLVQNVEM